MVHVCKNMKSGDQPNLENKHEYVDLYARVY